MALALAAVAACASPFDARPPVDLDGARRWWIFLGHSAQIDDADWRGAAAGADLVIFSDDPRLRPAQLSAATVRLAYLSIGEAEMERWYWPKVRGKSYIVEANPDWTRSVRVDLRLGVGRAVGARAGAGTGGLRVHVGGKRQRDSGSNAQ